MSDPLSTLLKFLGNEKRQTGRTILVTGPWGCGKTYLWKQSVVPALSRPQIYVSAFGADGVGNLKGRLLAHFALRLIGRVPLGAGLQEKAAGMWNKMAQKFGRAGSAFASSLNSMAGAVLRRADIDPLELADLIESPTVICIDDIERVSASFKMEELLGIANVLSEHKGFDVVLICNEDQIRNDPSRVDTYVRYKEKVISAEIHVSANPAEMFDRVVMSVVGQPSALKRIQVAKPWILEVFERSRTENLRILAKLCMQLEAMAASSVRELSETEIRFMTALAIQSGTGSVPTDDFFEFNPFVLRVVSRMSAGSGPEAPLDTERKAFLARYFGDADYECHPGILEFVRKGRIDHSKFVPAVVPELSGVTGTLSTVTSGGWRLWNDQQVGELLNELTARIEGGDTRTPREVLECLAYARFLAAIINKQLPETTTATAVRALEGMAEGGGDSLDRRWKMHMSDLVEFVKAEHDQFVFNANAARRRQLTNSIRGYFEAGDTEAIVRLLDEPDLDPLRAIFKDLGVELILALRRTNPEMFTVLVQGLMGQAQAMSAVWVEGRQHLEELLKRLEQIAVDEGEEHMTRWRVKALLKQR